MRLIIQPSVRDSAGKYQLRSELIISPTIRHEFFFVVEESDYHPAMEADAGPYLLSQLMHAMRFGGSLHVEGALCPVLRKNAEAFMRRWILWCPELFRWVDIVAEDDLSATRASFYRQGAISCFSGGVDSFYSYARLGQDHGVPLRSLMFLHGFDIDLELSDYYEETARFYRERLMLRDVKIIKVRTNAYASARKFQLNWGKIGHGIYLGAALHLLGHDHALACIPSSHSPDSPIFPWGSNPVTDPLLSSAGLPILHHNYLIPRFEKIAELAQHEDCLDMVRVCWRMKGNQLNCGGCPKCLATLVALEVASPDSWKRSFPSVTSIDSAIGHLRSCDLNRFQIEQIEIARHHAVLRGRESLAEALANVISEKQRRKASYGLMLKEWLYEKKLDVHLR